MKLNKEFVACKSDSGDQSSDPAHGRYDLGCLAHAVMLKEKVSIRQYSPFRSFQRTSQLVLKPRFSALLETLPPQYWDILWHPQQLTQRRKGQAKLQNSHEFSSISVLQSVAQLLRDRLTRASSSRKWPGQNPTADRGV